VPSLGPLEILVVFIVALLVFGPDKLPELARQVGKGLAEFRRVQHHLRGELDDAIHSVMDDDKPQVASPAIVPVVTEPPPVTGDPVIPVAPVEPVESSIESAPVDDPVVESTPAEPEPTPPPRADDAS
jgi:sec-independent protein translocase protein TatB